MTVNPDTTWSNNGAIYRTLPVAPGAWAGISSVYGGQEVQIEVRNQHVTAIYQAYPGHDFGGGGTWEQYEESECTC